MRKMNRMLQKEPISAMDDITVKDLLQKCGLKEAETPLENLTEWLAFDKEYAGRLDNLSAFHNVQEEFSKQDFGEESYFIMD